MRDQPIWTNEDGEVSIPLQDTDLNNNNNVLVKLMGKLPKIASKPIEIQHKQTVDEKFTLLVDEKPLHVISTNANGNSDTTTNSSDVAAADDGSKNASILEKKKYSEVVPVASTSMVRPVEANSKKNRSG